MATEEGDIFGYSMLTYKVMLLKRVGNVAQFAQLATINAHALALIYNGAYIVACGPIDAVRIFHVICARL